MAKEAFELVLARRSRPVQAQRHTASRPGPAQVRGQDSRDPTTPGCGGNLNAETQDVAPAGIPAQTGVTESRWLSVPTNGAQVSCGFRGQPRAPP